MSWFPLCNYTHYSLQRAYSKPDELVEKCAKNGYTACGIMDYKSITGAVDHFQACKKAGIKPIIGCAFDGFMLFAKNKDGWFDLIRIVSSLDIDDNYDMKFLQEICDRGNLLCIVAQDTLLPYGVPTCKEEFVKSVALSSTYYAEREHAHLHRILLCSGMKTTLPKINTEMKSGRRFEHQKFFESDEFYLRDVSELDVAGYIDDAGGCATLRKIDELCGDYNILSTPILPKFATPNGESEEEYLKGLCRDGWRRLLGPSDKVSTEDKRRVYVERFEHEFAVIKKAKLFGYFLIVQDILNWVREQGWVVGPGRGSAAGCLISYLIGITEIDPIEFDLLFERFYNEGRNTDDHISLPDVDMDVPSDKRDLIIARLREKYGADNVSQMITLGRMRGRSGIKEVLRVNAACGFAEMNEITKYIPDEATISDQLQEMDEDDRSIIMWALINNADKLADYCVLKEDGTLEGDYAEYFDQAIKMEGTYKSKGKHAAGVVISAVPLYTACPMTNQKDGGEKIADLEMSRLEAIGQVKLDVLGLSLLNVEMFIREMIDV